VTIPKEILEYLEIETNDQVEFVVREGAVVLTPVRRSVLDLRGFLKGSLPPSEPAQVREAVKRKVAEKVARREKPPHRHR
jgi:bifunctional DNA-binding transcriptional regulator/antitoxin component of YhaV-PrlF toxin-antitoxin module